MTWKLPLNQLGSGRTYFFGTTVSSPNHREAEVILDQHPWLQEILQELNCVPNPTEPQEEGFSFVLNVEKQSDCYRVKVDLKMNPQLECVRSLTVFRQFIEVQTEALYVKESDARKVGEHELSESEMEAYEHDGSGLIVSDFITDVVYTSLPDFPLCQPDCKGLCSECGCNLNTSVSCPRSASSQSEPEFHCPSLQFFN